MRAGSNNREPEGILIISRKLIRTYPVRAAGRLLNIANELLTLELPKPKKLSATITAVAACARPNELYKLGWPKKGPAIYRISAPADVVGELWRLASAESELRAQAAIKHKLTKSNTKIKHAYQMARLNSHEEGKTCLYVGQANALTKRLRQHFSRLGPTTFAMHLSMWVPPTLCDIGLTIEYWPYQDLGLSAPAIQALEDFIWEESTPVFGKQGAK
jgi:hypothetical protein